MGSDDYLYKTWSFTPKVSGDVYIYLSWHFFSPTDEESITSINLCDDENIEVDISGQAVPGAYDLSGTEIIFTDFGVVDGTYFRYEDFNTGRNIILRNLDHLKTYCITAKTKNDDTDQFGEVDVGIVLVDSCSNFLELTQQN